MVKDRAERGRGGWLESEKEGRGCGVLVPTEHFVFLYY